MELERYYVNKNAQPGGEHEVHTAECSYLPDEDNRIYLGFHKDCRHALETARLNFDNVDGCAHCCGECHTR